jgi:hypothetical protein
VQRRTSKNRNRVEPLNRNAKTLSAIMSLYWLKCGSRRLSDDVEPCTDKRRICPNERASHFVTRVTEIWMQATFGVGKFDQFTITPN